jgi:hypothetical protein
MPYLFLDWCLFGKETAGNVGPAEAMKEPASTAINYAQRSVIFSSYSIKFWHVTGRPDYP